MRKFFVNLGDFDLPPNTHVVIKKSALWSKISVFVKMTNDTVVLDYQEYTVSFVIFD